MTDVQARDDTDVVNPGDPIRAQGTYTGGYSDDPGSKSPDIGSLVGGGDKGLIDSFVSLDTRKAAEDRAITGASDKRMAADQARMDAAFKAEGVSAAEIPKPWNADDQHRKYEANPIEGFGSAGALFAMVASAFTKAPMENAINGMAGAINSIKEGNEAAYERAHQSWKENKELALERFKTQHELYSDAMGLFDHDAAAANAKLHNAAVRFGDSQMLLLAEHGMVKEMFELQESRAKAASDMADLSDKMTLRSFQNAAIKAQINELGQLPPDAPPEMQAQYAMRKAAIVMHTMNGGKEPTTAEQAAVGAYVHKNWKNQGTQEYTDGLADIHQQFAVRAGDPKVQAYNDQVQAWQDGHPHERMPEDVQHQILERTGNLGRPGGAGGSSQSSQARKTRAIEEIQQKYKDEGKPISMAEAERVYNKTVQIPSAHDVFQSDIQYDKVDRMKDGVNKVEDLLVKHKFITGIGGTLTRPIEAIANILGSNEADRKQFERDVLEIKELGQSALFDRSGRPLSSEAADAGKIFAGLKAGDTTANTLRAYLELRPVLEKVQAQIKARGAGKGPVSGGGSETPPTGEEPKTDWLSAYPEKK